MPEGGGRAGEDEAGALACGDSLQGHGVLPLQTGSVWHLSRAMCEVAWACAQLRRGHSVLAACCWGSQPRRLTGTLNPPKSEIANLPTCLVKSLLDLRVTLGLFPAFTSASIQWLSKLCQASQYKDSQGSLLLVSPHPFLCLGDAGLCRWKRGGLCSQLQLTHTMEARTQL